VRIIFLYIIILVWLPFLSYSENIFSIIDQTDSSVTIRFSLPKFSILPIKIDTINYSSINIDNSQVIGIKSYPDLPKFSTSIIVPENAQISFKTIDSTTTEYNNIRIIPSAGNLKRQTILSDYIEGKQYTKDEFYPSSMFSIGAEYSIRNINGISISVYPFKINTLLRKLIATTEIQFTIYYGKSYISLNNNSTDIDNSINQQFINYKKNKFKSSVSAYYPSKMLIVSKSKYSNILKPLISWKNQKGISTELILTDSISSFLEYKNLINNYYFKNNNSYVLLIGDSIDIPQRHSFAPSDNSYLISDNAYGYIIGNDSYPEVIIGRLAANSVNNLSNQIQKIIAYEKRTANDSNVSNYLMVASSEGPSSNGEYDYQHLRKIADSLKHYDYNGGDQLFDGSQGGADAIGDPSSLIFSNSINNGKGLFFYTGHSSGNTLVTSMFTTYDVDNFTNTKSFPFGVIAGCRAGQLSQDISIAEACLWANKNNSPTGLVAMLASTVDQWWNPPMGGQDKFAESLIHGNNYDSIPTFGLLALKSYIFINDKYQQQGFETTDSWSIFGDPSLQIFTKKADSIKCVFNKNIVFGQDSLEITSNSDKAWICLSLNNKILGIYKTNGSTVLTNFHSITDTGMFVVTVYGFNQIPYIDSVHILAPQKDFLIITEFSTTNKNAKITNGDIVYISLKLRNIGKVPSSISSIEISSKDNTISYLKTIKNIKQISSESEIQLDSVFIVKINDNTIDQTIVTFSITFKENSTNVYSIDKQITINAPSLCYLGKVIKSTNYSNLNNTTEVGEINDIGIILSNEGHASASINKLNISSLNSKFFSFIKTTFPTLINAGETDTIYFTGIFSNLISNGETIPFDLSSDFNNRQLSIRDYIKVGNIEETWENSAFNNYEWTNETSKSWFITNSFGYNSSHSLQSGFISDNESTTVSLSLTIPNNDSISFMAMTSCETAKYAVDHYIYYDYLDFRIDGTSLYKQAGITNWEKVTIPVASGFHTFSWTYMKDASASNGTDNAWIDNIVLPYFKTNWQNDISIISNPDTQTIINEKYRYDLLSNKDPNTLYSLIKSPSWLSLTNNILTGNSTKIGIDTIVISAFSNKSFTNQVYTLNTKDKVESTIIDNEIRLYPNPANDYIYFNIIELYTHFSIADNLGRIIQNGLIENNAIPISNLANNAYVLTIWSKINSKHFLFIKK